MKKPHRYSPLYRSVKAVRFLFGRGLSGLKFLLFRKIGRSLDNQPQQANENRRLIRRDFAPLQIFRVHDQRIEFACA